VQNGRKISVEILAGEIIAMRVLFACLFLLIAMPAAAQDECKFFSAEAADGLEKALASAPTCKAAVEKYDKCRWGSSADVGFAGIVIKKCEKDFLQSLNKAEKDRYLEEMELCNYEYGKQEGTLFISEGVSCHVYTAARYSENPKLADQPMPRASFDCSKAKTPLENAICFDKALGRADVVLSRAYKPLLNSVKGAQRTALIERQKKWLAASSKKCGVGTEPLSQSARACMRNEFEVRFMYLDGCGAGGPEECLNDQGSDNN
jgi:uncharacterized protein YecT (DUF1311 family)